MFTSMLLTGPDRTRPDLPFKGLTDPGLSLNLLSKRTPDVTTKLPLQGQVDVLLKAVGDTPIMKTKKWAVDRSRTVQSLSQFISRFLKLDANEQLFIYVNQSFAPSPDQEVGVLFDCFGSDSKLVLHYCKSQAWG
ncbi:ubiquitin-like protein ATG12 isoform X2 [Hippocampus comes]|uniref:Ubiquitin-like protein ATG12 n=1 Tax=Hippocampus comes TaxID=109280 RepID=A0A3Q2Z6Q2_HIPCM|nr:PREDICTED: ubiquitin-like protein ATG12 isoform X2 [Hippocampus comes]